MQFVLLLLLSMTAVLAADKLLFASVIWRDGQRAPSKFNGVDGADVFHRGSGQLTDAGRERSMDLGRALRRRYVDHGLISGKSSEAGELLFFHTTKFARCNETLHLVARGLFREEDNEAFEIKGIQPTPEDDFLIGFTWHKCAALGKIFQGLCSNYPDITTVKEYHEFEKLSFKCSRAGENATIFTTPERSMLTEPIIQLADSGAVKPEWMTPELVQEAREVSSKVLRFQLGLGEYRNEKMLKLYVGLLLHTILQDMDNKRQCLEANTLTNIPECKVVFKGYSTHDYILNALLELLGTETREAALKGFLNPQMSAAILIELWEVGGKPKVKVLYRPYALAPSLRDLTPTIEHCLGAAACHFEIFQQGYLPYTNNHASTAKAQCDSV